MAGGGSGLLPSIPSSLPTALPSTLPLDTNWLPSSATLRARMAGLPSSELLSRINDTAQLASLLKTIGAIAPDTIASAVSAAPTTSSKRAVGPGAAMQASLKDLVRAARDGSLYDQGYPDPIVHELGTWSPAEVTLATSILSAIAAAAAILLAPPPVPPLEQAKVLINSFLSRDFDGIGASALRTHIELGYPVTLPTALDTRGGTSSRSPNRDVEKHLAYSVLWPGFNEFIHAQAAAGGLLRCSWDVSGGFMSWLSQVVSAFDRRA